MCKSFAGLYNTNFFLWGVWVPRVFSYILWRCSIFLIWVLYTHIFLTGEAMFFIWSHLVQMVSCWVKKVKCQNRIAHFLSKQSFCVRSSCCLHRHSRHRCDQNHCHFYHTTTTLELTPEVITASSNSIHRSIATSITASTTDTIVVSKFITTAVLPSLHAQQALSTLAVPLHMSPVKTTATLPYLMQIIQSKFSTSIGNLKKCTP